MTEPVNDKFEFTGETKIEFGITFRRIRFLKSINLIAAGTLGGWLEKESNLNVSGNALVSDNARVWGNARILGNARVWGNARILGNAHVSGDASVWDNARVWGNAHVWGNARVWEDASVWGNAHVSGDASVSRQILAASRSDGYLFVIVPTMNGPLHIQAGCRDFTIEQAREHWTRTRSGTSLGDESLAIIDHLERMAAITKLG